MIQTASMILGLLVLGQTQPQSPPKEWVEANQWLVGSWDMSGTIGGKECKATYKYSWVDGKFALRGEATWAGDLSTGKGAVLIGWDASRSQDVTYEVWSDGAICIYRSKISGKKWTGVGEGADETGQGVTCRFEQEILSPDKGVFRATLVKQKSKEEIPVELFFTRVTTAKTGAM